MTAANKILAVALVFGVGVVNGSAHRQAEYTGRHMTQERYVVQPGDTFWGIAQRYFNHDERGLYIFEYHDELWRLNPAITERKYQLQPGDVINIRYYKE